MKCINCFFRIVLFISLNFQFANADEKKTIGAIADIANPTKLTEDILPVPPPLAKDEYAIFIVDKYIKFKTKKFKNLEFDLSCFKSAKPDCEALKFSEVTPKNLMLKRESMNNMGAIFCEAVHGRNLLALDNKKNEYNFCRFHDGSMVNSWSLYYSHFPKN